MVEDFAEALISAGADADAVCGAGHGERSRDWVNRRKWLPRARLGHQGGLGRARGPDAARGQPLPGWLLQPRRRAEQAFVSVIADAYLAGVDSSSGEAGEELGVERMSKSQVSRSAKSPDQIAEDYQRAVTLWEEGKLGSLQDGAGPPQRRPPPRVGSDAAPRRGNRPVAA